jgi:hypothetical protein
MPPRPHRRSDPGLRPVLVLAAMIALGLGLSAHVAYRALTGTSPLSAQPAQGRPSR